MHVSSPSRRSSLTRFLRLSAVLPLVAGSSLTLIGCGEEDKVMVIGHRGASALRPEHTLASYRKAVEDGADVIEPDLVPTKDGVLVARHENEISGTTNVSTLAKFEGRKATKMIDGVSVTGWFTEDFTLAELKELRARERIPAQRPGNVQYNDQFEIPTLAEVINLAKELSDSTGRTIHIAPETKHPTYFQGINLALEDRLITELQANDFSKSEASVYIQSFETTNLKYIREKIGSSQDNWKLMQLIDAAEKAPYDLVKAGDSRIYRDLLTEAGIKEIATYADGVSPYKLNLISVDAAGAFQTPTDVIRIAHDNDLVVHSWTFRPENAFLPAPLKAEGAESTRSEAGSVTEIQKYLEAGLDGFFTDDPAVGRRAVDGFKED
ncbi:glycerophosphodiester phosphodiesterase [Hyalangium rubrum]|uniref:glycerophosphodiester phosphodiesterase n=1 Tax=Hyalangium rubrum TaxID=3103134 RepID=A0ABU5H123_9BACT|nr:glycerophosphodiester phosphodiesterase [Hyalangium sp. s54d21]MDY7226453.1 glycerophosphodiester phosphodiesterase [Hyalangium sp. s54d21]